MNDSIFSFFISRTSDDEILFDTAFGGLLFSDQYIQLSAMLSTNQIFGFGEHIRKTLMHDLSEYKTWGMNARDAGTDAISDIPYNYYGVHPFYLALNPVNQKAHGVFILNSNAQEVTLGPGPHLIYRTIGGQLELFFFPGPTPEAVIQQYQQVIGRPYLPPYWGLGYQLCRWGYNGTEEILGIVNEILKAGIPQDGQCADIDYMEGAKTFTYNKLPEWKNLPNLIDDLRENYGIHFILVRFFF
uniref:Alpha-glucosidase n=1 Tax=Panagrolaimus sp. JU765 TaxID=591449 RepID=A0AC34QGZ9_9BILA